MAKYCRDCAILRNVIHNIWWMARRYANGRMTYAVEEYNEAIKAAQNIGMKFEPDSIDGSIWAKDGDVGMESRKPSK